MYDFMNTICIFMKKKYASKRNATGHTRHLYTQLISEENVSWETGTEATAWCHRRNSKVQRSDTLQKYYAGICFSLIWLGEDNCFKREYYSTYTQYVLFKGWNTFVKGLSHEMFSFFCGLNGFV
jgi:hypothetical protein